jgi:NAD-dependent deacetylase
MSSGFQENLERAATILGASSYRIALTGAGISVESGIPPFRGIGGLWTKLGEPSMTRYQAFLEDPKAWWEDHLTNEQPSEMTEFQVALANATPNAGHDALVDLEKMGLLQYLITQNVDGLHIDAGTQNIAEIHGNTQNIRCMGCGFRVNRDGFLFFELPPQCPECQGIMKSDGVMFGEPIPTATLAICQEETLKADCVLILGTSATVHPAAGLPEIVYRNGGNLIEVNPEKPLFPPSVL